MKFPFENANLARKYFYPDFEYFEVLRKRYHDSKELKTLKLSEYSFCLHSRSKNCTGVFSIANNRDYSAFRTLIYVPLCRLHFGSDCNELFSAFEL